MVDSVCELLVFRDMQSKYSWREPRLVQSRHHLLNFRNIGSLVRTVRTVRAPAAGGRRWNVVREFLGRARGRGGALTTAETRGGAAGVIELATNR